MINSTYEAGSGYRKHTMYKIEVKLGERIQIIPHRFSEFKKLDEKLK
jgi:hypothetical protein